MLGPQAEKSDVGLRIFTTMEEHLWYYCFQFAGHPPLADHRIDFVIIVPLLPSHYGVIMFNADINFQIQIFE